jgi:hypothetical protein
MFRTYAAKHVVSLPWGFDIQFITRIYKDAISSYRFDMTVGAIFSPKMGLRVYRSPRSGGNGIFILSPFGRSSTMNERVHKKMGRYDIVPVSFLNRT